MVIGEQGLAALAWGKFEELYEIEEAHEIEGGLHWAFGWDFSPLFRSRFSVDFSPLFGLGASRETRVSKDFTKVIGGFGPFLSPILDGLFTVHFIMIRGLLSWAVVVVLEVVHVLGGVSCLAGLIECRIV
jgi:hypothetical protein